MLVYNRHERSKNMLFGKDLLTEKGNLKAPVVSGAKAQARAKIDLPLEATPNGTFAMVLGTDENGHEFYLTVSITVGSADPFVKVEKKAKASTAVAVEVPNIFE
jgi:hypothetical protein